jgi:hypothetical protein
MPLLPTAKLAQIQNVGSYICFHFTLLRRNLHVATALTYRSKLPHLQISFMLFQKLSKTYISTVLVDRFFTRIEVYTKKDVKLFHKCIDSCVLMLVHTQREKKCFNKIYQFL